MVAKRREGNIFEFLYVILNHQLSGTTNTANWLNLIVHVQNIFFPETFSAYTIFNSKSIGNSELIFLSFLGIILGVLNFYGTIYFTLYILLTSTEIIVLKVIYIYKFSTIAAVNEDFLKNILIIFNIIVSGVYILILLSLKIETSFNPFLSCLRSKNPLNVLSERTDLQDNAEL